MIKILLLLIFIMFNSVVFANEEKSEEQIQIEFSEWVNEFKKNAVENHKIDKKLLDEAFINVEYKHKVIHLDRNQPEFKKTFWGYYDDAVHPLRIKRGKIKLEEHKKMLKIVEKKYNVPSNIILAFWGMETDYGRNIGNIPLVNALSTLSFDRRRSKFFTEELVNTFKIIQSEKISLNNMVGSWAGAFGHFQFLPSTYLSYAVDCDGDGKADIRNSIFDAFCSAGNFLSKIGWNGYYRWGRPVNFNKKNQKIWEQVNSKEWKDVSFFSKLGVRRINGNKLPKAHIKAKLIAPMGIDGPIFLVYDNFKHIMRWNNSVNYALSIGLLSDAIIDNKIGVISK